MDIVIDRSKFNWFVFVEDWLGIDSSLHSLSIPSKFMLHSVLLLESQQNYIKYLDYNPLQLSQAVQSAQQCHLSLGEQS